MADKLIRCYRCGGILIKEDGESKCLMCGRINDHMTFGQGTISDDAKKIIVLDVKKTSAEVSAKKHGIPLFAVRTWMDKESRTR